MQFEVHGNDWMRHWTEEARLAVVIVLLMIVIFNLMVPLGPQGCDSSKKLH